MSGIDACRDLGIRHFMGGIDLCTPTAIEEFARVIEVLDRRKS
jgi:hypothetical protein